MVLLYLCVYLVSHVIFLNETICLNVVISVPDARSSAPVLVAVCFCFCLIINLFVNKFISTYLYYTALSKEGPYTIPCLVCVNKNSAIVRCLLLIGD